MRVAAWSEGSFISLRTQADGGRAPLSLSLGDGSNSRLSYPLQHPSLGALAAGTLLADALVELGHAEAEAASCADGLAHLEALGAVMAAGVDLLELFAHCRCFLSVASGRSELRLSKVPAGGCVSTGGCRSGPDDSKSGVSFGDYVLSGTPRGVFDRREVVGAMLR